MTPTTAYLSPLSTMERPTMAGSPAKRHPLSVIDQDDARSARPIFFGQEDTAQRGLRAQNGEEVLSDRGGSSFSGSAGYPAELPVKLKTWKAPYSAAAATSSKICVCAFQSA